MSALAFGAATHIALSAPLEWAARLLSLRPARDDDLPYLRTLYAQTRADEMAGVPWPPELKARFLDDQFALQHRHYTSQFASAGFLVIEAEGEPIGRLYVDDSPAALHIIDISIEQAWHGQGLGSALLRQAQQAAAGSGRPVTLNVNQHNPRARRLYDALGFEVVADDGVYTTMRWLPAQLKTA